MAEDSAAEAGAAVVADSAVGVPVAAGDQAGRLKASTMPLCPTWAKGYFTESDLKKISEAVHRVELETQGEVVPVIVRRSYPPVHLQSFLLVLGWLVVFVVETVLFWEDLFVIPLWGLGILLVGWWGVVRSGVLTPWALRRFTPREEIQSEVLQRAQAEFLALGLTKTEKRTGVLILISWDEHQVQILGDEGIHQKLPEGSWGQIVAHLVQAIKDGRVADGLTQSINECGDLLKLHFPGQERNENELKNDLVFRD